MSRSSVLRALVFVLVGGCFAFAEPPALDDLDAPLDSILLRKSDVLAANAVGIFWANLERKEWQKLTLPAEMPAGGRFATVPEDSQQIVYYAFREDRPNSGQKLGIYHSSDAGKTWKLLVEKENCGPVALLESGDLFAVTNAHRFNGPAIVEVSHDQGKTWRDITGNSFGEVIRLFPDPDHRGLICLEVNSIRPYIVQAANDRYEWKATRAWDWHPERLNAVPFGRSYSTSASNNPLYMLPATLRSYFQHDFGRRTQIPAIDLAADKERFTFRSGDAVAIPLTVRFQEDKQAYELRRKHSRGAGDAWREFTPTVEKLLDHPSNLGLWGLRIEFRGERTYKQPAVEAAVRRISDEDFAARLKGEAGRGTLERNALIDRLKGETGWRTVEFSAAAPYQRILEISKLHDFQQPGEYRVQLDYDSDSLANRDEGHWVGSFSSPVFTLTITPRD